LVYLDSYAESVNEYARNLYRGYSEKDECSLTFVSDFIACAWLYLRRTLQHLYRYGAKHEAVLLFQMLSQIYLYCAVI
jgi:protoheme ferro-lyase